MINRRHNQGVVLIYALLVIGLLTAIALTVSLVIINELKLTSSSTDGTLAYYAAESGIEKGLYGVKVKRDEGVMSLTNTVSLVAAYAANFTSNNASYANDQTVSGTSLIINRALTENEMVQADYYDVDNPLDPDDDRIVNQVLVSNSGNNPDSWAEVSWIGWDATGLLATSVDAKKIIGPTDLSNGWTINLANVYTAGITPVGYRLRVRALFGPITGLSVFPSNSGTEVTVLPSQVIIKSVGKRNTFKQALTATVPWRLPLSGLYDYVLFSEGELSKDIILSRAIYSSGVIQVEANASADCADCATCQAVGWSASACTAGTSCTSGSPFYCAAAAANNYFTLPIPSSVTAAQELYISVRVNSASTSAEVTISDPAEGEVGFTFNPSSSGTWKTCTIPEPFSLGSGTVGRSVIFKNLTTTGQQLQVDWYQISSYKIFPDCPT
ncbi:MAG: pilus assembly PilX N-terminal domain-containing protein [Patescibacteria group bacterium]